jgi:PAS domain-containing protein
VAPDGEIRRPRHSRTDPQVSATTADLTPRSFVEQQFGSILRAAPDAIVIADQQGHIVFFNDQTEQLFGYPNGDLLGLPVEPLLPARHQRAHVQHRADYQAKPTARPSGSPTLRGGGFSSCLSKARYEQRL